MAVNGYLLFISAMKNTTRIDEKAEEGAELELQAHMTLRWRLTRKHVLAIGIAAAWLIHWLVTHASSIEGFIGLLRS